MKFWVEYHLHKDKSWIAQGFATKAEMLQGIKELEALGYKPKEII